MRFKDLLFERFAGLYEISTARMYNKPDYIKASTGRITTHLKDAKIFLTEPGVLKGLAVPLAQADFCAIPLPFKDCYFETCDKEFGLGVIRNTDGVDSANIYAVLVTEIAPGVCASYVALEWYGEKGQRCIEVRPSFIGSERNSFYSTYGKAGTSGKEEAFQLAFDTGVSVLVQALCQTIHDSQMGVERIFRTVNLKTQTCGKQLHKVEHVIRLRPHIRKDYVEPAFSREIDWNERWWVRGHWRKLPGPEVPGKDRSGEYNVKGFTWVTEHLRGPEDKPIRKAIYTLGDTNAIERHQTI